MCSRPAPYGAGTGRCGSWILILGARARWTGGYLTVSVPCIPACWWESTLQKKVYLPDFRLLRSSVEVPPVTTSEQPISPPLGLSTQTSWGIAELGLSKSIATFPAFAESESVV